MSKAIIKAMEERLRQINEEGFTAEHDDVYKDGQLVSAASAYGFAYVAMTDDHEVEDLYAPPFWPWDTSWWKPSPDPRRNIIKAMALLAAEYDRLERAEAAAEPEPETLYSTDDEWQSNKYDDLNELIADRERVAGDVVYTGAKRWDKATDYTTNLHESVIEGMQLQAEDEAGEIANDYPSVTKQHEEILQALIDAWATSYCSPDFYTIANVQEYTITAEDVERAHA
ncbi:hypothetical protein [Vreelandella titanicae]|uniref:hypothetical protein n=1 Tax=Vreelandella titanicae TaxID=664683 RepID=UPI003FD88456